MKEYKIVSAIDSRDLEKEVNEHLNEGWMCQGGVAVVFAMGFTLMQAMIKMN